MWAWILTTSIHSSPSRSHHQKSRLLQLPRLPLPSHRRIGDRQTPCFAVSLGGCPLVEQTNEPISERFRRKALPHFIYGQRRWCRGKPTISRIQPPAWQDSTVSLYLKKQELPTFFWGGDLMISSCSFSKMVKMQEFRKKNALETCTLSKLMGSQKPLFRHLLQDRKNTKTAKDSARTVTV